ncbi:MAG: serine protein kinase RIO [Methanobacteriaceae archaeon]|jgi:RIO kinase 1|nr:MAG: serine/threonine protein kinase [Methanobacterium sp. BRmetb2]MCC7557320.1 serine protein kinase RIO [Methanobacteriaceae archaeon]
MNSKVSKADADLRKMLAEKRIKSIEDKRVGSEVFDQQTLETLYKLAKMGYINQLYGVISTGKEANVFKGIDDDGNFVAVKIYRITTSDFKKMKNYIQGDPRFRVRTSNKRQLVNAWVTKEYRNLKRARGVGVKVPTPMIAKNNVLIMEFIGDDEGNPALPMQEVSLSKPDEVLNKVIKYIKMLYKDAKLVHGDLSGFNILINQDEPVIIDISQGMVTDHPMAKELLDRDIDNIVRDFNKMGISITKDEIKAEIMD